MLRQRIYFGHPINVYNTELEEFLLLKIVGDFAEYEIENPNQPYHSAGYEQWKAEHGNGMDYFYERVLPFCQAGVFLPFRDGAWGKGVFGEAEFLVKRGHPVFKISPKGVITRVLDLASERVLTVDATRERIRANSGIIAPY